MKVIFLDIDGVMTSNTLNTEIQANNKTYPFSKECVDTLNEILSINKVKIVLTSSWRIVFSVEKQCEIFKENGVIQMPYGQTEDLGYENRSKEIDKYLRDNKKVSAFVILDDMEIEGFGQNYIKVNLNTGLNSEYVAKVNRILQSA